MCSLFYFFYIRFESFVIPERNFADKIFVGLYICKIMVFSKDRFCTNFYEVIENGLLIGYGRFHSFLYLLIYITGKWLCQDGFNSHYSTVRQQTYRFLLL